MEDNEVRLQKVLASAGLGSRRKCEEFITAGRVTVNGEVIDELGSRVDPDVDIIHVDGVRIAQTSGHIVLALNKPRGVVTTMSDDQGRECVGDLVAEYEQRLFHVGRLDADTEGLLLLTNDGELAQKLTHPSFEVKKIYEVTLDKAVTKKDLELIVSGVTLEDGFVQADSVGYADSKSKNVVGIEIHSGRNRIVRRIFESLGYVVEKLDRVMYANLTKKNIQRGKWRFLTDKEIIFLKHFK